MSVEPCEPVPGEWDWETGHLYTYQVTVTIIVTFTVTSSSTPPGHPRLHGDIPLAAVQVGVMPVPGSSVPHLPWPRFVYLLDFSPSAASPDICVGGGPGAVLLDQQVAALRRAVEGVIRPFYVPGSQVANTQLSVM